MYHQCNIIIRWCASILNTKIAVPLLVAVELVLLINLGNISSNPLIQPAATATAGGGSFTF